MTKGLRQLRRARAEKLLVVGDREIQLDPRSHVSRVSIRDSRRPIDRASSSNRRPACRFRPTRGPAPTHETAAGRVRTYVENLLVRQMLLYVQVVNDQSNHRVIILLSWYHRGSDL
jgi:hypothetical protein